ncbi:MULTISPECIES: glycosyltransferase [unclassified Bradyrhizobium]|uniref:glycosyltransferase n=1 Tax=unclassified Bradyrhizobium TaxID=2631580 RepID=UPI002917014E|nr:MULTISPECIES: glycosyltransferase [unclassified Bradyrhizobium]
MVQYYLEPFGPTLLVAAVFFIFVLNSPRQRTWVRTITCTFVLLVSLRYLWWRFHDTVLPYPYGGLTFYWVWFLFSIELLAFAEIALFLLIMSRYVERSAEADRLQAAFTARPQEEWPTIDVFIPTYDEPIDVLERTIVGSLALDYPKDKFRVYVLDDKQRDWLKVLCEEKRAIYVSRPDNSHAKAGNLNHGLGISSGEFVAIFDADFVPYRQFLRRTAPFFRDPTIGIVQTPQHFFNKDPIQSNLSIERVWPDEQRLFFDELAASRDAWDVSFCCGSCSIIRRRAIEAIGGIPTESVTEDLLTTLEMLNKGYKTRYLNERLSMGLAAENLRGYFIQRSRWCLGGIQSLFVKNGPIHGPGLTLLQRIMFMPTSWLIQYIVRFCLLIVPIVFLWTGVAPLFFTSTEDIIYYQMPVLLAYFLLMKWITPSRYLPVVSNAVGVFATFRLLPTVIMALIKPFGAPFRVTPKGSGAGQGYFDGYTFSCISVLVTLTVLGVIINIVPEWSTIRKGEFSVVAMYWAGANVVLLVIAALICFEKPRVPVVAFFIGEPASARSNRGRVPGRLISMSLESGTLEVLQDEPLSVGDNILIEAAGFPPLPSRIESITRGAARKTSIRFTHELDAASRDRLIVKLYTGDYSQEIRTLDTLAIMRGLWKRAFGRTAIGV